MIGLQPVFRKEANYSVCRFFDIILIFGYMNKLTVLLQSSSSQSKTKTSKNNDINKRVGETERDGKNSNVFSNRQFEIIL